MVITTTSCVDRQTDGWTEPRSGVPRAGDGQCLCSGTGSAPRCREGGANLSSITRNDKKRRFPTILWKRGGSDADGDRSVSPGGAKGPGGSC